MFGLLNDTQDHEGAVKFDFEESENDGTEQLISTQNSIEGIEIPTTSPKEQDRSNNIKNNNISSSNIIDATTSSKQQIKHQRLVDLPIGEAAVVASLNTALNNSLQIVRRSSLSMKSISSSLNQQEEQQQHYLTPLMTPMSGDLGPATPPLSPHHSMLPISGVTADRTLMLGREGRNDSHYPMSNGLFQYSPPTSPNTTPTSHSRYNKNPPILTPLNTPLDSTCLACGEVFDSSTELHPCTTTTCARSFCSRCIQNASTKGVSLINPDNGLCAICDYQSVKRPNLSPHEWHWTFNDHSDLEFTRSLRDSLPAVPGLFLEIHGMRQACWRRRIGGVRKHYSFKQHGGFFEGRLQALQITMTMFQAAAAQASHAQRLMNSMLPSAGRGNLGGAYAYGSGRYLPSGFTAPSGMILSPHQPAEEQFCYGDQSGLKRKQTGNFLNQFPATKRRTSMVSSETGVSAPWFNPGDYATTDMISHRRPTDMTNLSSAEMYIANRMKKDRDPMRIDGHYQPHIGYNVNSVWEGPSTEISSTDQNREEEGEPRCAICCEFVTKRSSHVCTCQIQSCSRVFCLHCVQEGINQGVYHFNGQTGCCAICLYQNDCVQSGQSTRLSEAWHTEFDPQMDSQFLREYTNALPTPDGVWFDIEFVAWRTNKETFTVPLCGGLFEARWAAIQSLEQDEVKNGAEMRQSGTLSTTARVGNIANETTTP